MDHKPDKLLICHWNARSLNQNKQSELKDFLATHNIDICLVSETYLENKKLKFLVIRLIVMTMPLVRLFW